MKTIEKAKIDIEHEIENQDNLDMYSGWKLYKKFNMIRHERRKVKNDLLTMSLLIHQLNNIKIEKDKISEANKRLKKQRRHKSYIPKVLKVNCNLNSCINSIKSKDVKIQKDEIEVYSISSKLPKDKGSTIGIEFKNEQQKQHIINKIANTYNYYNIDEKNNIIELIERI